MKTMKTLKSMMIAAIILCGTSMNAQAQNNDYYQTKDEVGITIGGPSNSQIITVFSEMFGIMGSALVTSIATGGNYTGYTTYENEKNIPAISAEYFHHLNKTVSIGGIVGFNGTFSDMYCTFRKNEGSGDATVKSKEKVGSAKKYFITVMPAVKFDWLRHKNYGLYSKMAFGLTYMYEQEKQDDRNGEKELHSDSKVMGNFQASLLGIEAGSEKFRGFAELGVGEQGIFVVGCRYKF